MSISVGPRGGIFVNGERVRPVAASRVRERYGPPAGYRLVNFGYANLYNTKTKKKKSERARRDALKRALRAGYPDLLGRLLWLAEQQKKWNNKHRPRVKMLLEDAAWLKRFLDSRRARQS